MFLNDLMLSHARAPPPSTKTARTAWAWTSTNGAPLTNRALRPRRRSERGLTGLPNGRRESAHCVFYPLAPRVCTRPPLPPPLPTRFQPHLSRDGGPGASGGGGGGGNGGSFLLDPLCLCKTKKQKHTCFSLLPPPFFSSLSIVSTARSLSPTRPPCRPRTPLSTSCRRRSW